MSWLEVVSRMLSLASVAVVLCARPAEPSAEDGLRIVVWKHRHVLELARGEEVLRRFRVSLGVVPRGPKESLGDGKTPVGRYRIYEKHPSGRFRRFLALSYPAAADADRALDAGRISVDTWSDIRLAEERGGQPPWRTPLGGFVGIHGAGATGKVARWRQTHDWTKGCIALSDRDIDELYAMTPVGTEVEIREE